MIDENEIGKLGISDAQDAIRALRAGKSLVGLDIRGDLDLNQLALPNLEFRVVDSPVRIQQCRIETLDGGVATYNAAVEITDSLLAHVFFYSCFFTKGLRLSGCRFQGEFDFISGGHNSDGPVLIEDCTFQGFANFRCTWFEGPIILRNVRFQQGSNLLGLEGMGGYVRFDVPPLLENIQGDIRMPTLGPGWEQFQK